MDVINSVYKKLLSQYGRQGWWPILDANTGISVYSDARTYSDCDRFEIACGAILTQNTTWKNAEKALFNIKKNGLMDPERLNKIEKGKLAELIRSSGYYNQKAAKIINFLSWFSSYRFSFEALKNMNMNDVRKELLSVNGIGNETADSIILYSLEMNIFVVDAYTVRIFKRIGKLLGDEKYNEIQSLFHDNFTGSTREYKQYHALIVKHAKEICTGRKSGIPLCRRCCIKSSCKKLIP